MKFSESWLREWVNPAIDSHALAHQITMAGLEVDDICAVAGDFTGVVIGEVVECCQHPDADKLRVTKVNIGQDELLDIVCGAPNCCVGLKVAVATVGAVLPGDFKIKKAKLRGQPSHGMLCSFSELGIDVESNGILELPKNAPVGTDFREYLQLNDVIIDVDLTANRADCLSIRGLARETAVLNSLPLNTPEFVAVSPVHQERVAIEIQAKEACPRYLGRVIKQVNLKAKTPLWMQEKLRRSGIRSIDPVVDITNYVMIEQGQPMHAFDLSKISGGIVVRMAKDDEKLTLLDGNEASLKSNTLVIADHQSPLAIAGIFGGQDSGVTTSTTDILFEAAFFAPSAIRGRARSYGLHTDSSHRFERGVDAQLQRHAMERATQLLVDICGGEVGEIFGEESDEFLPKSQEINLTRTKLDGLLGYAIESDRVTEILNQLGCSVDTSDLGWDVQTPSWRFDLNIEVDLIEEVGRIFGYDNIPNQSPVAALTMNQAQEKLISLGRVKHHLVARGFQEAITYSFVEPRQQQLIVPDIQSLDLPNPISIDMSAMRLSLLPGLLNTAAYNQKRQQSRVRIFESGLRFIPDENAENGLNQEMLLAGLISGNQSEEHWDIPSRTVDFFDLKGDLESVLALTGLADRFTFRTATHPALHPGQTAVVELDDQVVGYIGTLHPELEKKFDLNGRTIVFEIEWAAIESRMIPEAEALSKYPANRRDIALIVDDSIESDQILRACTALNDPIVISASLFDVYKGDHLGAGKKSLAVSVTLQSKDRTLEESEIAQSMSEIVKHLSENFAAVLRD